MTADYSAVQQRLNDVLNADHAYPADRFYGRGIVICAGGLRYFTNAYVCVSVLRMLGCRLPVQFWHLGPGEMTDEMKKIVAPLGVECVDAYEVRKTYPARTLNGWELKPYAMIYSRFSEVICLDADNVPLIDPEKLFETTEYANTGAIFWPDYGRLAADREIWKIMQVEYRDEPEFESGQIVVDKRRCWKALQVTMHLNEWSDFYYSHIHGDKETFHMAWRKIGQQYSMPSRGIHSLAGTMCQHDFNDNIIFQHRNMRKWALYGANESVADFKYERECLSFLDDLRKKWNAAEKSAEQPEVAALRQQIVKQRYYTYARVGYDSRTIELCENGAVNAGPDALEQRWIINGAVNALKLSVMTGDNILIDLLPIGAGMFSGAWLAHERMPVILLPIPEDSDRPAPRFHFRPGTWDAAIWASVVNHDEYMLSRDDGCTPWPGDVIDVGAHIGAFSHLAVSRLRAKHVFAVEPDVENLTWFKKNLAQAIEAGVVTAIHGGISADAQPLGLQKKAGVNTGDVKYVATAAGTIPAVSLQALIDKAAAPVFLKLDCEGCEYSALLSDLDTSKVKEIVGEFHEIAPHNVEELQRNLEARGYTVSITRKTNEQGLFSASRS